MAESMLVAFGRFLRLLRERRGLSLDRVEALTAAYPEPVSKAYLSRTENGHSRIAFSRMIALCRAYDYPIDAASERLWLDLGVDKMDDPPRTEGKDARDLLREGREYLRRGFLWHAYACARDAIAVARTTPVSANLRDLDEQFGVCIMNTATAASKLGRKRYALAEFLVLEPMAVLAPEREPLIHDRIAVALCAVGRTREASARAERAVEMASREGRDQFLGDCLTTQAFIAYAAGDAEQARRHYHDAFRHHRARGNDFEAANVLLNLAQISFDRARFGTVNRFLAAASRITERINSDALRVRVLILAGEVNEVRGKAEAAERCWRDGQRIAAHLNDTLLSFKARFFLFRQALRSGRPTMARRLERALVKLSPWVPPDTEELRAFHAARETRNEPRPTSLPRRNKDTDGDETRTPRFP